MATCAMLLYHGKFWKGCTVHACAAWTWRSTHPKRENVHSLCAALVFKALRRHVRECVCHFTQAAACEPSDYCCTNTPMHGMSRCPEEGSKTGLGIDPQVPRQGSTSRVVQVEVNSTEVS